MLNLLLTRDKVKEEETEVADERQKRKLEKSRLKYEQQLAFINAKKAQAQEAQDKIQKYQASISVLTNLLGAI